MVTGKELSEKQLEKGPIRCNTKEVPDNGSNLWIIEDYFGDSNLKYKLIIKNSNSNDILKTEYFKDSFWRNTTTWNRCCKILESFISNLDDSSLENIRNDLDTNFEKKKALKEKKNEEKKIPRVRPEEIKIDELLSIIEKNFPGMSFYTECCLSFVCALLIEDLTNPLGLNLEGAPSSEKTTILSFFYELEGIVFKSDNFTPKSFVSHSANISEEDLANIDLLPKIKDKVMILPELAPLFGKRKEDLIENLSVLTRVFDGEGLETDSGSRGHRGYTGSYLFIWLGATTPIPNYAWQTMGKLGQRFLFLKIPQKKKTSSDLKFIMKDVGYKKKILKCRQSVHDYLNYQFFKGLYSIKWDREKDSDELKSLIVSLAQLLSRLRAPIEVYNSGNYLETDFEFKIPVREEPERAISHLFDIARGHAILSNRNYLTMDDARVVFEIAFSSCPFERHKFLELFIQKEKFIWSSKDLAEDLNCSERNARRVMKTLEILELGKLSEFTEEVSKGEKKSEGRQYKRFTLNREYETLIKEYKKLPPHGVALMSVTTDIPESEASYGHETDTEEQEKKELEAVKPSYGHETDSVLREDNVDVLVNELLGTNPVMNFECFFKEISSDFPKISKSGALEIYEEWQEIPANAQKIKKIKEAQ